jgi:hypothetical protein
MKTQGKRVRRLEDDYIASQRNNEMLSRTILSLEHELQRTYRALDLCNFLQISKSEKDGKPRHNFAQVTNAQVTNASPPKPCSSPMKNTDAEDLKDASLKLQGSTTEV